MKRCLFTCLLLTLWMVPEAKPEASDAEVEARRRVLELAGAFSNDGFKLRDGNWTGSIKPGEPKLIQVNLYAGNEYWFSVAATDAAKKLVIKVFNELGQDMEAEPYAGEHCAAAGFAPGASGPYYIRIEEVEGEPSSFSLLYSYK
jgi:hypothetical protein